METICITLKQPAEMSVLKQIFDLSIEETIDDERVQRILEPVIGMIRAGYFDRRRYFSC